jgi:hypothetical protein
MKLLRHISFVLFLLQSIAGVLQAQDSTKLPATDIYLVDISIDKRGNTVFENPALITKNENYDNEPWWYPDGSAIMYASVHDSSARDSSRADVYRYDMRTHQTSVVINTPQTAEFSPEIVPNKTGISVVRVMPDGSQVFAKCNDKEDNCETLLPKMKNVGYYVWIDASRVALYLLGDPAILVVVNLATGKTDTIAEDVGRCLQKVPGKNVQIAFVDKASNPWTIKMYDGKGGKVSSVVPTMDDQEDFCFMPDGSLLMGSGTGLYKYTPPAALAATVGSRSAPVNKNAPPPPPAKEKGKKKDSPWEQVADFKNTNLYQFYRIAVSPKGDKMAVVTYFDEKP